MLVALEKNAARMLRGTVYINWSAGGITYALRDNNHDGKISLEDPTEVWEFPKIRGTLFWSPYNKALLIRVLY